jgi:hypothetical protein
MSRTEQPPARADRRRHASSVGKDRSSAGSPARGSAHGLPGSARPQSASSTPRRSTSSRGAGRLSSRRRERGLFVTGGTFATDRSRCGSTRRADSHSPPLESLRLRWGRSDGDRSRRRHRALCSGRIPDGDGDCGHAMLRRPLADEHSRSPSSAGGRASAPMKSRRMAKLRLPSSPRSPMARHARVHRLARVALASRAAPRSDAGRSRLRGKERYGDDLLNL